MNELPIHTPVFIWGRPEKTLILLFGEGTYEGVNQYVWPPSPIVRLDNGKEITVHYQGVVIGERGAVKEQCEKFKGNVIEWELERFLKGDLPTIEQRATPAAARAALNDLPVPKTATDRLLYIKREIEIEQLKIKARRMEIEESEKKSGEKRAELKLIKDSVLAELASLEDVSEEAVLLAAERIKAERAAAAEPVTKAVVVDPEALTPDDFRRLATED